MALLDRLHALAARLGISPKVFDPFLAAVALVAFNLVVYGTFDVDELRLAVGLFVLGAIGVAAPPANGVEQSDLAPPLVVVRDGTSSRIESPPPAGSVSVDAPKVRKRRRRSD